MNYIQYWKSVFLAIFLVAIPFLIWDILFTQNGVWGFNPQYHLNKLIFGLPIEEILFFICIPYASVFTHYAIGYFFPNLQLSKKLTKYLSIVLFLVATIVIIFNAEKWYTFINLLVFVGLLAYSLITKNTVLQKFYITFLVILIPFFIVNGILTGSFIQQEVVWYNNAENLGIRLFTIPVEDVFYAFNMLFPTIVLIEKFKLKFNA